MTAKSFLNLQEKAETGFLWLSLNKNLFPQKAFNLLYLLTVFLIPTQLGKHFWPEYSYVYGLKVDYLSPVVYAIDIAVIMCFLVVLIDKKFFRDFKRNICAEKKMLITTILFFVLNIIFSSEMRVSVFFAMRVFEAYVFYHLSRLYLSINSSDKKIYFVVLFSFGIQLMLSFMQQINKGSINGIFYFLGERDINMNTPGAAISSLGGNLAYRSYGTFSHPNVLAWYLSLSFLFLRKYYFIKKSIIFYLLTLAVVSAVIFTLSRTGAIILFFVLLCSFNKSFKYINKIALNKIIVIYLILNIGPLILLNFVDLNSFQLYGSSVYERAAFVRAAADIIKKNFFTGIGLGTFTMHIKEYQEMFVQFLIQPVHNIMYLFISETGGLGVLMIVYLIKNIYKKYKKFDRKIRTNLKIFLIPTMISGLFDHYILTSTQAIFIATFVFVFVIHSKKNIEKETLKKA